MRKALPVLFLLLATALYGDTVGDAVTHLRAQEESEAFRSFLSLLDGYQPQQTQPSADEQQLYDEVLAIYVNTEDWREAAVRIHTERAETAVLHPEYHLLAMLVAISEVNLGKMEAFMERFGKAAYYYPDHYLVDKVRGIFCVKLAERGRTSDERQPWRQKALTYLLRAQQKYPQDRSLGKILLHVAQGDELLMVVRSQVERGLALPRQDIESGVRTALEAGDVDLARKVIEMGRRDYGFSRSLGRAEDTIKNWEKPS